MDMFIKITILAILIEAVWESVKMIWQEKKIDIDKTGVIVLSIVATFVFKVDLFNLVGLSETITWLGIGLTGVIVSRGGNFIHDLLKKIGKEQ